MSKDLKGPTIAVIGKADSGKTTTQGRLMTPKLQFIRAVCDAASGTHGEYTDDEPTSEIVEYRVPLSGGLFMTFLDTPGFDGNLANSKDATTEGILNELEKYIAENSLGPIAYALFFLNTDDMTMSDLTVLPRKAFERVFQSSQVACLTAYWDRMEFENEAPFSVEEVADLEERLYASGRTGKSLLEYLEDGREDRGYNLRRFRSGLPIEGEATSAAYTLPQDIVFQLLSGQVVDTTLRERLAAMTKERDELAAKLHALPLQEKFEQAPTTANDAAPPQTEAVRTPRTRRQRLLDTIDKFSAQVLEMVADLEREALDVADECAADRAAFEAASAAIDEAEGRFAEITERVKIAEEERVYLGQERDGLRELEQSLTARLDEFGTKGARPSLGVSPSVDQRLGSRLKHTQASLKDTEDWISGVEEYYQKARQDAEQAAAEIEKWKHIRQGKERELNEWLSRESEQLLEDQESFRTLYATLCTSLDAMREGLNDSWEGKLGDNPVFWERLDGRVIKPEILAHPGDWATVIESFYQTGVTLALTGQMAKFHSTVVQRLKVREDLVEREWKKCVQGIFLPSLPPPPPPLTGHNREVNAVAFSWDGMKIVSGSSDDKVRVWDALTGKAQAFLEGHSNTVTSVAFSPNGEHIVSGSGDRTVRVWSALTGRTERVLVGHTDWVGSVNFSQDGTQILSGSNDKTVRIWDTLTGQVLRVLGGHTNYIYSAVFSGDGAKAISGSWDGTVRVWDALTGTAHNILKVGSAVHSIAVSGDNGRCIVTGSSDRIVRVWDGLEGKVLQVLKGHSGVANSVAVSPDGSWIISGSYDKTLRVWDASTGNVRSVLEGHSDPVYAVALSRDGRRIASGSQDKSIRVWDMASLTSVPHGT
ncbi:hypothetical protein D9611_007942 [Ephemerocybe angulata]|uniref:G domain-containing protein n=1 Tax=Ephemerocybe angulata TaxID=980116 RepID=A0A8H5CGV4_9AGAR|nr:hypothetical protein D9611_007942 [Tulosesus angulatus]